MASVVPISNDAYTLGLIGAGKMAESIARGVVNSGVLPASRIRTAHLGSARRTAFQSFGVHVVDQNHQVVEESDVVIFSVKPQVLGAASMATDGGKHPGQLKDDVTSPGGTTIAGIHELEKGGFRGILMNAVAAAAKRSRELSQS